LVSGARLFLVALFLKKIRDQARAAIDELRRENFRKGADTRAREMEAPGSDII
jgi:hypothetical protein